MLLPAPFVVRSATSPSAVLISLLWARTTVQNLSPLCEPLLSQALQKEHVAFVISPHPVHIVQESDVQPPLRIEDGQQQVEVLLEQSLQLLGRLQVGRRTDGTNATCYCYWIK